jgi:multicomponent K+:H+ antiporter subunit A
MPMLHSGLSWGDRPKIPGSGVFVALWLIAIACAIGAAWQAKYHRLAALIMVSVCGLMTCITFVWFSAPDLALTQLVVEVVTTVLILLGLRWLPRRIEGVSPLPGSLDARACAACATCCWRCWSAAAWRCCPTPC